MSVCKRSRRRNLGHCAASGPGKSSPSFQCVCVCVCVCVCARVVFWDMLHRAERKSVGMCVRSIMGMKAERCFTSLHIENKSLYQYMIW